MSNLADTGYSEKRIRQRLRLDDLSDLRWRALPTYRRDRLSARDPLDLAIDLFLLQASLPPDELDRLLPAPDRDLFVRTGLLSIDQNGRAQARASLFPVEDRLVFSDPAWPELTGPQPPAADRVMYIGPDSRQLARCTSRRPVRAALDLCTGSGVHAVLAAAHADRVVAVDINPRAVACARFNALALGISNLEVRIGDLFEPVAAERFDLITANPPFVPSPSDEFRFRDGGRSGEDIQKRIVAELPLRLAPEGIAQIVTELPERDGEPLLDRLRQWLAGAPIDIYALRLSDYSAADYAVAHAKGETYDEFLRSVDAWTANLRAHGFIRIAALLVSFQWSDPACGPPWQTIEDSRPPRRAAGTEIEAAFHAERLTRRPELAAALDQCRLALAGPVALLDAQVLAGNVPASARATRLGQALSIEHPLAPIEREVLTSLQAPRSISQLAALPGNHDRASILAAVTSLLRKRLLAIHLGDPLS